jgi:hypothetical protein
VNDEEEIEKVIRTENVDIDREGNMTVVTLVGRIENQETGMMANQMTEQKTEKERKEERR